MRECVWTHQTYVRIALALLDDDPPISLAGARRVVIYCQKYTEALLDDPRVWQASSDWPRCYPAAAISRPVRLRRCWGMRTSLMRVERSGTASSSVGAGVRARSLPIISIHHQAGLDCNQYYHLLWLPDCSGRKTEQCGERRGESSRGFGMDRPAGYRLEQGCSGDRTVHSPSPPQRSQPKCSRLR